MQKLQQQTVTFEDILEAKEKRAELQKELRERNHSPIASITINMPGNIKYSEETVDLAYYAVNKLRLQLRRNQLRLLEERVWHSLAGPFAVLAIEGDAVMIKELAIILEEERDFGRLLDIDVFDSDGRQINRGNQGKKERTCFVCARPAVECIRTQSHGPEDILSAAKAVLNSFKAESTNSWPENVILIGNSALEAMLMEAACTPAPGLVDRDNSGAHADMDIFTFLKSSSAISQTMYRCAMAGWEHKGQPEELLAILRRIGIEGEKAMFAATHGVNAQKGMIFLMGIVSAAAALVLRKGTVRLFHEAVLLEAAAVCKGIVDRELSSIHRNPPGRKLTAGERFYLEHGITGIRGEIEAGLPSVKETALPCLRLALSKRLPLNDALVHALIGLMADTQDTTILNRHDLATLSAVQAEAASIMEDGGMLTELGRRRIMELDDQYIKNWISPGGSADLLAVAYFLHVMEERLSAVEPLS